MSGWLGVGDIQSWDYAVRGVCRTQCMLYSLYAVFGIISWLKLGEMKSDDLTSCSDGIIVLRTRKREMRADGGNHREKQGLQRILYASQFSFPNTTGRSTNRACNNIDSRSAKPNKVSRTPYISYLLISSTLLTSSSPNSLFLVHNSTIITDHNVKSSLSISPCHYHPLTLSTAYTEYSIHQVQHTPSTAYTKYNIHQVQHTPSTASTPDCLSSLHSHDYELTPECRFCFKHVSLHDWLQSTTSQLELRGTVTFSQSHGCELSD